MKHDESRRGYVLWEVTLGGALLAIFMVTMLTSLADARVRNAVAGRDVVAGQLIRAKIEEMRARGQGVTTNCINETPVPNQDGLFSRDCAVTAGGTTTINGMNLTFDTVTVTVSYTTITNDVNNISGTGGLRTVSAETRRYQ